MGPDLSDSGGRLGFPLLCQLLNRYVGYREIFPRLRRRAGTYLPMIGVGGGKKHGPSLGAGPPSRRLRVFPYYGGSTKNLKYAQASLCILAPGASEPPGSIYHATSSHKVRATNLPSVRSRRGCRRAEI